MIIDSIDWAGEACCVCRLNRARAAGYCRWPAGRGLAHGSGRRRAAAPPLSTPCWQRAVNMRACGAAAGEGPVHDPEVYLLDYVPPELRVEASFGGGGGLLAVVARRKHEPVFFPCCVPPAAPARAASGCCAVLLLPTGPSSHAAWCCLPLHPSAGDPPVCGGVCQLHARGGLPVKAGAGAGGALAFLQVLRCAASVCAAGRQGTCAAQMTVARPCYRPRPRPPAPARLPACLRSCPSRGCWPR